jgi:hypothetical protein
MATEVRLDFLGWARSGIYGVVPSSTRTAEGRLTGRVHLTLRNLQLATDQATEPLEFDLLGPGDVVGLKPGAVSHMVPAPGTPDFEETKCAYVELAAADLPWRYTPELAVARRLRPWLVLVVARATEAQLNPGGTVTLSGPALAAHPLAEAARWAHVQDDADHPGRHRVARILSPRNLDPQTDYLAILVPAMTPTGQPAWTPTTGSVALPVYHWWSFSTGEAGDFPTLAARLKPAEADPTLGRAPLDYKPLGTAAPALSVRGALAPIGSSDDPTPQPVANDLIQVTAPVVDPLRPVITVPTYGEPWTADPADPATNTTWGATFRTDPRPRGIAGLGLHAGILLQDLLSDAAAAQAGALDAAAQRIRHLATGLAAAGSLWTRRLPADPMRRLAIFGPALRRMMTATGTVRDRAAGGVRPLPPALFSSAARRVLRPGPARSALAGKGAGDPAAVIAAANRCPPPPERAPKGLPHADGLAGELGDRPLDDEIEEGVDHGRVPFARLKELIAAFPRQDYKESTLAVFDQIMRFWLDQAERGAPLPVLALVAVLDPTSEKRPDDERLLELLGRLDTEPDTDSLLDLGRTIRTKEPERPCLPVNLVRLAGAVAGAVDPTGSRPFVVDRVLGTISGLDGQPLTPPELCPDLDLPAWQFLRDHDPDWLLPGAQQLAEDAVTGVSTNPAFVDAFLLGLNTQVLGELRFRNIPVVARCTPLRQFWARANPARDSYDDDIVGVHLWPASSALGDASHQTPAASGADLVVVFRSPLFRRYPGTLVYLTPAPLVGGAPDWTADPDFAQRVPPAFQGQIAPDLTFFGFDLDPTLADRQWVVLEEPPRGYQFFNAPAAGWDAARVAKFTGATDGADFAHAAFADPYRIMIRGESLVP